MREIRRATVVLAVPGPPRKKAVAGGAAYAHSGGAPPLGPAELGDQCLDLLLHRGEADQPGELVVGIVGLRVRVGRIAVRSSG